MNLPVHILYETSTDVEIDVPVRPAATQTVSLYRETGGAIFTVGSAALSTINTTLNGAVAARATSLVVASATGISAGREFWLRTPDEKCLCKTISGTTVTLHRPLIYAHATGVVVEGTRLTYTVTAAQASTLFWDGYLEWLIDDGTTTERAYRQHAICTRHAWYRVATEQDLFDDEPLLHQILDDQYDVERLLDDGLADVVRRVAARTEGRAWSYSGPHQFAQANVLASLMRVYRRGASDASTRLYERYRAELEAEIERLMAFVRRDENQDGSADLAERYSANNARLYRA